MAVMQPLHLPLGVREEFGHATPHPRPGSVLFRDCHRKVPRHQSSRSKAVHCGCCRRVSGICSDCEDCGSYYSAPAGSSEYGTKISSKNSVRILIPLTVELRILPSMTSPLNGRKTIILNSTDRSISWVSPRESSIVNGTIDIDEASAMANETF